MFLKTYDELLSNVIAYLNTYMATTDNIGTQWIDVVEGKPVYVWDRDRSRWMKRELELGADMQAYLDGFESYNIVEANGVKSVEVTYGGQEYTVLVEGNGIWVRNYDDMAKLVNNEDLTFDMETAEKVFTIRTEEGVDDIGQPITLFDPTELKNYYDAVAWIYKLMDKSQLGEAEFFRIDMARPDTLTGDYELGLVFNDGQIPSLIGVCSGPNRVRIASIATKYGVMSFSYIDDQGIGYTRNVNVDSSVEGNLAVLANRATVVEDGYAIFQFAMKSERNFIRDYLSFTITNPKGLARYWGLAGTGTSFYEFDGRVNIDSLIDVFRGLNELEQPLSAYMAYVAQLDGSK